MHATISIHHAAGWIARHARGADVMAAHAQLVADAVSKTALLGLDGCHPGGLKIALDKLKTFGDAFNIQIGMPPIHTEAVNSKSVLFSVQGYAALRIGRLFGVKMQAIHVIRVEEGNGGQFSARQYSFANPV